jgi:hypothetical protein
MSYTGPMVVQGGILRPVSSGSRDIEWLVKKVHSLEKRIRELEGE